MRVLAMRVCSHTRPAFADVQRRLQLRDSFARCSPRLDAAQPLPAELVAMMRDAAAAAAAAEENEQTQHTD